MQWLRQQSRNVSPDCGVYNIHCLHLRHHTSSIQLSLVYPCAYRYIMWLPSLSLRHNCWHTSSSLSECYRSGSRISEYTLWVSDITHFSNKACAKVYLLSGWLWWRHFLVSSKLTPFLQNCFSTLSIIGKHSLDILYQLTHKWVCILSLHLF